MHPLLDAEALRSRAPARYFGLGFIQIKLDAAVRLHFWVPDWPTIPGAETELHDHRYVFESQVLTGALEHELFVLPDVLRTAPEGTDEEIVAVSCKPEVEGTPQILGYATPRPVATMTVRAPDRYRMDPLVLHRARPIGVTITQVTRGPQQRDSARVVRSIGAPFVCPFALPITEEMCWDRVRAMCAHARAAERTP